jgi:beta-N-acetylhexosaminidase
LNMLPMGMTAHVVFSAIDPAAPATTSEKVVREVIRGDIGFDGLLMSDDTSMKALSGDFREKAQSILAAGVDMVLHCNGVMEEMAGIAAGTTALSGRSLERANRAIARLQKHDAAHEDDLRAEFGQYFEMVA